MGVVCAAVLANRRADTEEDEEREVDYSAPEEDCTTAEEVGEGNGKHGGNELEA